MTGAADGWARGANPHKILGRSAILRLKLLEYCHYTTNNSK